MPLLRRPLQSPLSSRTFTIPSSQSVMLTLCRCSETDETLAREATTLETLAETLPEILPAEIPTTTPAQTPASAPAEVSAEIPAETSPRTLPAAPAVYEITDMLSHLTQLCETWRGGAEGGGNVHRFREDWPQVAAYFQERGLPCHNLEEKEFELCLRSEAYAFKGEGDDATTSKQTHISVHRPVEARFSLDAFPAALLFTEMNTFGSAGKQQILLSIPKDALQQHLAKGWAVWHPPTPPVKLSEFEYWHDTRDPAKRAADTLYEDNPLSGGSFYLGTGHALLTRWSGGQWKLGNLLGRGGDDAKVKSKTATYAPGEEWCCLRDDRVATSRGHIIVNGRPPSVSPGWGGYDAFTRWQASGRKIYRGLMERPETPVTNFCAPVPFTDSRDRPGRVVRNSIPETHLPRAREEKFLFAVVGRKPSY
ncbi:hypothetical protein PWT90_05065 [Aphanocladium album]|nr:hypothetical protein PWT90_05065 [Aphanocladium album]